MITGLTALAVLLGLFWIWRSYYFFRDPERAAPPGDGVLAPADGVVVYVHPIDAGVVPVAIKQRRSIRLEELLGVPGLDGPGILIGIFMRPWDVHVNRCPVRGQVRRRVHRRAQANRTMVRMLVNIMLGRRPFADQCLHLLDNERNTLVIDAGGLTVAVTQIADAWVNRIVCDLKEGDLVERGQRYGMIRMGSQVDVLVVSRSRLAPRCRPGDRVRAGQSVLMELERPG
jgi:phosphatidylserine decarboxylase